MEVKDQQLIGFEKDGEMYSIRISEHGALRANQRDISRDLIVSGVFALTINEVKNARDDGRDIALIDEDNDVALIVGMNKNTINIITVIAKSDIWVKEGTKVKKI